MGDQKVPMFATNYIIQLRHSQQKGGEGYIHVLRGHKLVSYFRNIHNSNWISLIVKTMDQLLYNTNNCLMDIIYKGFYKIRRKTIIAKK